MKALLKKDLLLMYRSVPLVSFVVLMLSVFCAWGRQSSMGMLFELGLLTASMVATVLEIEEGNRWHVLQDTMPLSRAKVVQEKYLLLGLGGLAVSALQCLLNAAYALIAWEHVEAGNLLVLPLIVFTSAMLWGSIILPFFFRFGSARGRGIYHAILALGLVLAFFLARYVKFPKHIALHPLILMLGLLGVGLLLGTVSCLISVHLYRRRDLR